MHQDILDSEWPTDEPPEERVLAYASQLGMDLGHDTDLLWIARERLKRPLPEPWKACRTTDGEIYYFNFTTGESVWDRPFDEEDRRLFQEKRKEAVVTSTSTSWTAETHARCFLEKRACVVAMLSTARRKGCPVSLLPLELMFEVFAWTWQSRFVIDSPIERVCGDEGYREGFGIHHTPHHFLVPCNDRRGVAVITFSGTVSRYIGADELNKCRGVVTVGELVFACDFEGQRVVIFRAEDGTCVRSFKMKDHRSFQTNRRVSQPGFAGPHAIASTGNGRLVVSTPLWRSVEVFCEDGTHVRSIQHSEYLQHPEGLAVRGGEVFVACSESGNVCVFRLDTESS